MTRIAMAVIYLVSLVSASSAQVVGAASTRPANKPEPTARFEKKSLEIKQDNTQVKNNMQQVEQHVKAKLSTTSEAVVEDCHAVSRALGLDAFYKALGVNQQKPKETPQTHDALAQEEAKNILRNLSTRIYQAAQGEKSVYAQEALKTQAHVLFPVFESLGALNPAAKKWEAGNLRHFIRSNMKACTSGDADKCHAVLTAIRALPVLDEKTEQGKDALLVSDFLEANYQSPQAASVLQTCAIGLMSLGRPNMLVAFIQKAEGKNIGFFSRLGNSLSFEYWSEKGEEMVKGGERWITRANQASYYKIKKKSGERLGNIYQDLGELLATEQENGKYVYRSQIDLSGFLHAYENGALEVSAPAFVTGALLGGMTLPSPANLKQMQNGRVLDGQGKGRYEDHSKAWDAVQNRLNQLHTNMTGLALQELYAHPKAEMSYAQRTQLNNRIVARYNKITPKVDGKQYRPKWMQAKQVSGLEQAVDGYFAAQNQTAQIADIGIAVLGIFSGAASGFGIAKLSSFGIRMMSKARYMIGVIRAQKGTLTVTQLRGLAQLRIAAKGSSAAARGVAAANVRNASVDTKQVASPLPATKRATKSRYSTSQKQPVYAQEPAKQQQVASAQTTPATAETANPAAAENTGATTRAPKAQPPAEEPGASAVSPTQLKEEVTGPLAQKVEKAKKAKKAYESPALTVKNKAAQSDLLASGGGAASEMTPWEIDREERRAEETLQEIERMVERAKAATRADVAARYVENAASRASTLSRQARYSSNLKKVTEAAQKAERLVQEAKQFAADMKAIEEERMAQAIQLARSDKGIFTPLGSMNRAQALKAIDPLATELPIFRRWIPMKEQTRMLQGVVKRITDVRQSFSGTIQSIHDIFSVGNITPSDKMARALAELEKVTRACASDTTLDQKAVKINALLDQIVSNTNAAQKRELFRELKEEYTQFFDRFKSYKSDIQSAARNVYKEADNLELDVEIRRSGIERRAGAIFDLVTDELKRLDNIKTSFISGLDRNIVEVEKKASRIAAAARNKAEKRAAGILHRVSSVGKSDVPGVYPLNGSNGQAVAYAKVTTPEEITRTRQVQQIIDGNNGALRSSCSNLEIDYPKVLRDDLSGLPTKVQQTITQDMQKVAQGGTSRGKLIQANQHQVLVMSAADTKGVSLWDLRMLKMEMGPAEMQAEVLKQLGGKPITQAEWNDIEKLINGLNKSGFEHGDLGQNLFIGRNPQSGKLKVGLIDFEKFAGSSTDQKVLANLKNILQQVQVLVP